MQQPWMVNWLLLTVTLAPLAAQAPTTDATSREAFAHDRAGQEQLGGERWDAAAQGFRAAIALDPRFVDAHCGLGQAYVGATRFASAAVAFSGCLDAARAIHGLRDRDRVAADRQLDELIRELKGLSSHRLACCRPSGVRTSATAIATGRNTIGVKRPKPIRGSVRPGTTWLSSNCRRRERRKPPTPSNAPRGPASVCIRKLKDGISRLPVR